MSLIFLWDYEMELSPANVNIGQQTSHNTVQTFLNPYIPYGHFYLNNISTFHLQTYMIL